MDYCFFVGKCGGGNCGRRYHLAEGMEKTQRRFIPSGKASLKTGCLTPRVMAFKNVLLETEPQLHLFQEVNGSIGMPGPNAKWYTKMFAFTGLGFMVSVGYMDPGNWATDLSGGAAFGYMLLTVIMMSSFIAMFLQVHCCESNPCTFVPIPAIVGKEGIWSLEIGVLQYNHVDSLHLIVWTWVWPKPVSYIVPFLFCWLVLHSLFAGIVLALP